MTVTARKGRTAAGILITSQVLGRGGVSEERRQLKGPTEVRRSAETPLRPSAALLVAAPVKLMFPANPSRPARCKRRRSAARSATRLRRRQVLPPPAGEGWGGEEGLGFARGAPTERNR